jgi:phenylacetate-coenzyme A ligase PaaK-like adenylate-forming protein
MTRPGRQAGEAFFFDAAVETLGRGRLAALQFDRLKATLERAYERVPHFTRAFRCRRRKAETS